MIVLGVATKSFVFTPSTATSDSLAEIRAKAWNPATATLGETVRRNLGFSGWSKRSKMVVRRTAVLMLVSGVNTFVQTYVTVEGVEAVGAAGYAGVWVAGAGITGLVLGLVGAV